MIWKHLDSLAESKTKHPRTRINPTDNQKESGRKGMMLAFLNYLFLIGFLFLLLLLH